MTEIPRKVRLRIEKSAIECNIYTCHQPENGDYQKDQNQKRS
jgi:hypothetical protein